MSDDGKTANWMADRRKLFAIVFIGVAVAGSGVRLARSNGEPGVSQGQYSSHGRPVQSTQAAVAALPAAARDVQAVSSSSRRAAPAAVGVAAAVSAKGRKYSAGEDPAYAAAHGWPVNGPAVLAGSLLPEKRIVAYYGNPLSKRMGVLGEYDRGTMLAKLKSEVARWQKADPSHPVQPALHLVATVAQADPGKAGMYRMIMPDKVVNEVYETAKSAGAIMFIDIQTGHENIRTLLPRFEWLLKNPDVHLGIDPEFNLVASRKKPGTKIGTYDAADVNYAAGYLEGLVKKHGLPPKVLVVHRFTKNGVTGASRIKLRPEVQVVMNMDGWGAPWLKRDSYRDYVVKEPVQYTGFKLFYHNDTKKGDPLMSPADVLRLEPEPLYIQYQ